MGHWYKRDGTPCHYQPDGKDTTLRHARTQNLAPSVTTILDILDKPGLTNYLINQHLEAAWGARRVSTLDEKIDYADWCKEIRQIASEHAQKAREKGSAIHHALDIWYSDSTEEILPEYSPYVSAVEAALSNVYGLKGGNCTPEESFATDLYGGAVDLSNPEYVIDFKYKADGWEKKKDGTPKKIWYDTHVTQLAAYREGLGFKGATCANVFISPEAEVYIKEWSEEELEWGLDNFMNLLRTWKHIKRF